MKPTSNPNLFVLKYRKKVFFDNLWNDFLRECRGMIVDSDFNLVSYPFTKIHNFRVEADAPVLADTDVVAVVRKVNGFMVAMTHHNGELLVSTTGSIDSDFVAIAKKYVTRELASRIENGRGFTYMFECCDPSDPHIVHEEPGLYLLGARENTIGSSIWYTPAPQFWEDSGVLTLPVETKTVAEMMAELKTVTHEGFVMYAYDNEGGQIATKCKSPHYLTKKLFMRGNLEKLLRKDIKQTIDEEYYPLIDHIAANKDEFIAMDETARRKFIEAFLEAR